MSSIANKTVIKASRMKKVSALLEPLAGSSCMNILCEFADTLAWNAAKIHIGTCKKSK
jgi:hypothetical protein